MTGQLPQFLAALPDPGYFHRGSSGTETTRNQEVALTNWTQWLSLHVDWTFFSQWPFPEEAGSGEKKKETKKEGREGGRKEGKMGGSVDLSRLSSQRPRGREKREDRSLMATYVRVGQGESRPPESQSNPNVCLPAPPPSLHCC